MHEIFEASDKRVTMRYLGKNADPSGIYSLIVGHENYKFRPTAEVLEQHVDEVKTLTHAVLESDYQKYLERQAKPGKLAKSDKAPVTT